MNYSENFMLEWEAILTLYIKRILGLYFSFIDSQGNYSASIEKRILGKRDAISSIIFKHSKCRLEAQSPCIVVSFPNVGEKTPPGAKGCRHRSWHFGRGSEQFRRRYGIIPDRRHHLSIVLASILHCFGSISLRRQWEVPIWALL